MWTVDGVRLTTPVASYGGVSLAVTLSFASPVGAAEGCGDAIVSTQWSQPLALSARIAALPGA
ncbi:MAG: hypothetical protein QOK25_123 [Thermoleophilaceae bacterium]|jgi:hypothetical protein|nr:hypothetical protein [Thermoleophilaceae bacterium]